MKRLFSFILALALVLSLSVTAFAAGGGTGTITITNATVGHTYKAYKIFDATYDVNGAGETDAVSYTISKTILKSADEEVPNPIFVYMFGTDGKQDNPCFAYNADMGTVTKKSETVTKEDIAAYLSNMIRGGTHNGSADVTATNKEVEFTGLEYGYYVIDKTYADIKPEEIAKIAVTIDSNTPNADVIDKNQKPATSFDKLVWDDTYTGTDAIDRTDAYGNTTTGRWVPENSANIGDMVDFKVEFTATNYDGDDQIKYYSVMDTKGDALWVEFDKITVQVGTDTLERGYYHGVDGTHNTGDWEYLGDWTGVTQAPDNAEWYLVHYGFDQFEIVIPWMSHHDFTGTTTGFTLAFGEGADSIYASPVTVILEYTASVEPGANVGAPNINNLWNAADLSWTHTITDGPDNPSQTTTKVYALGVHKIDETDKNSLAGAVFELYSDKNCTKPVYVIPTNVKGIYMVDDLNTNVSGQKRESARKTYEAYLADYLGADYASTKAQKNVLTTEVNGKIIVLGLQEGTYYLKETVPPEGYNVLPAPQEVHVGDANGNFFVVADEHGNVIDAQDAQTGYTKLNYAATSVTVTNSKGLELPSTGGEGTMMLITIGTMMAIAFAVLLITQKKMSVYQD